MAAVLGAKKEIPVISKVRAWKKALTSGKRNMSAFSLELKF
jgi:hypothetical protein